MYKKIEVASCRNLIEGGREYLYRYYLLEGELELSQDGMAVSVPSYGIFESAHEVFDGEEVCFFEEAVECVSPDRIKVLDLIYLLKNNNASPIHLIDIIGEKVDEWVTDFDDVINEAILGLKCYNIN